jgi:hypothetical protein
MQAWTGPTEETEVVNRSGTELTSQISRARMEEAQWGMGRGVRARIGEAKDPGRNKGAQRKPERGEWDFPEEVVEVWYTPAHYLPGAPSYGEIKETGALRGWECRALA